MPACVGPGAVAEEVEVDVDVDVEVVLETVLLLPVVVAVDGALIQYLSVQIRY